MIAPQHIIEFWREAGPQTWFAKSDAFDASCRSFDAAHHAAARGELEHWRASADGALGLCLLLDQIPRNLYRGSAHAFATDGLALAIADASIKAGFDAATPMPLRLFFYLPFEHAENHAAQDRSVALVQTTGDGEFTRYALLHRDIVARFGRFPHRNACLGRASTPAELSFLAEGGFAG